MVADPYVRERERWIRLGDLFKLSD